MKTNQEENMFNEQQKTRFEELVLTDDQFLNELIMAKTAEDTREIMLKNGFEVSLDEVHDLIEQGSSVLKKTMDEGELSDADLEEVAGGGQLRGALRFTAALGRAAVIGAGFGALCAVCPAAAAATPYVIGYTALTSFDWIMKGYAKKGW